MIGCYTFLPWLRSGVANTITAADGADTGGPRALIHVDLKLSASPVAGGAAVTQTIGQDVALYGPGDIVGIESRAIVRTEPRNWITNFEANYLPAIEFKDPDFPWRYTPAAPNTPDPAGGSPLKLRPWIALVVLKESEFSDGQDLTGRPLPYIVVPDTGMFPVAEELWAWAHVHFNGSLAADPTQVVSTGVSGVLSGARAAIAADPDVAYSRFICPRQLEPNTAYHAFLIPVFETGRLTGLGHSPDAAPRATASAWAPYASQAEPTYFPLYYRWYFRTGTLGDFEYLVGLLKPQKADAQVGIRNMDVLYPGSGVPGIGGALLGGVLRLGGALRVPDADLTPTELADRGKYDHWDQDPPLPTAYPQPFERKLAAFINLADDYTSQDPQTANTHAGVPGDDPDPLITPPLYGRWHALTQRLLVDAAGHSVPNDANWVHRLNLDPVYRVPAGFGAQVVEKNAESYMNAAWGQIGDVLAANSKIRRLHLAAAASSQWYSTHLVPLFQADPERAYSLAAPVARRVLVAGRTIAFTQSRSVLASTLTSTALRRVVRPRSRLMRTLPFGATITRSNLLTRVNSGQVAAAPPKTVPAGVPTLDEAAGAATTVVGAPPSILDALRHLPWLAAAILAIVIVAAALALLIPAIGFLVALAVLAVGALLYWRLRRWGALAPLVSVLSPSTQTPAAVDALPMSPSFTLSEPGAGVVPVVGTSDSVVAARFKDGLRDSFNLLRTSAAVDASVRRDPVDLTMFTATIQAAINPDVTIFSRGFASISIPAWARQSQLGPYAEVMAYPKIDLPTYQPLKDISIELFLPNISLIAPNSITLIETNRKFVEAYMVGLNHEFARKLLWREYPTDQRGSYFRQFWDPAPYFDTTNLSADELKEKLYDIPPLHTWPLTSLLGEHPNPQRAPAAGTGEDAVLVIRGELLKKYPTAVIYAHKAQWQTKSDGSIDPTKPRQLVVLTDAEQQSPPPEKVRTPLYEAKADPDIYFFGFDLTTAEARGGTGTHPGDDPGWFFVLKERPGEPRFGLELSRNGAAETYDQLTWNDAIPGGAAGQLLPAGALAAAPLAAATGDADQQEQHAEDVLVSTASVSSARWAYLLFRAPVMVAVHAAQMLGAA